MLKESQLVSIFCEIDHICKELDKNMPQPLSLVLQKVVAALLVAYLLAKL